MPEETPEGFELKYTEDGFPYYQESPFVEASPKLDDDPFARAAQRIRRSVKGGRLPMQGPPAPEQTPNYLMEPDLLEAQQGAHLPTGIAINDAGIPFNLKTGVEVPTIRRPDLLPVAKTPEGYTFAMPKLLDIAGNIMGNVGGLAGGRIAVKPGEMVLGSGAIKKGTKLTPVEGNPFTVDALEKQRFNNLNKEIDAAEMAGKELPQSKYDELSELLRQKWMNEQGFNVDAYHGTVGEFKGDKVLMGDEIFREPDLKGQFYSAKDPKLAEDYTHPSLSYTQISDMLDIKNPSRQILPLKLNTKDYLEYDAKGGNWHTENQKAVAEAKRLNKKGVVLKNVIDDNEGISYNFNSVNRVPTTIYITLDPSTVRSRFAKFNPQHYGKSGLLLSDTRPQVTSAVGHALEKQNQPFFSALERAVDDAKLNKGSAEQWLGYLKNQPGVKSEEINTVLGELKGTLSKEEVQQIVKSNKVELKEKVLGSGDIHPDEVLKAIENGEDVYFKSPKNTEGRGPIDAEDFAAMRNEPGFTFHKSDTADTKFHQWQLPGGSNYQEIALSLPAGMSGKLEQAAKNLKEFESQYRKGIPFDKQVEHNDLRQAIRDAKEADYIVPESHRFDSDVADINRIVHVRHNDRIIDGGKTLHLEEIQSDWHQAGRKSGYKQKDIEQLKKIGESIDEKLIAAKAEDIMGNPDLKEGLKQAVERKILTQKEADDYLRLTQNENATVPDAPFKKNWDELALKRMLHKADNEGYEGISWTPGEAQAIRYDLSKHIDNLEYGGSSKTGDNWLTARDKNDNIIMQKRVDEKDLVDNIGKEAAEKLIKQKPKNGFRNLENADLKIGGEGMKAFYDKMLVDKANALAKKYGSKVEERQIPVDSTSHRSLAHFIDWATANGDTRSRSALGEAWSKGLADSKVKEFMESKKSQPIHYLPITPELRAKAKAGFPLFSSSPTLTAVTHDPFNSDKKYKLTPVEGNPFQ